MDVISLHVWKLFDLRWKEQAKEIGDFMYLLKKKENTGRKFKNEN